VLDLQNFCKKNNAETIDGQEGGGEVGTPAQKNDKSTMAAKF